MRPMARWMLAWMLGTESPLSGTLTPSEIWLPDGKKMVAAAGFEPATKDCYENTPRCLCGWLVDLTRDREAERTGLADEAAFLGLPVATLEVLHAELLATSSASISRAETPIRSVVTTASLILAPSRTFLRRLSSALRSRTGEVR